MPTIYFVNPYGQQVSYLDVSYIIRRVRMRIDGYLSIPFPVKFFRTLRADLGEQILIGVVIEGGGGSEEEGKKEKGQEEKPRHLISKGEPREKQKHDKAIR